MTGTCGVNQILIEKCGRWRHGDARVVSAVCRVGLLYIFCLFCEIGNTVGLQLTAQPTKRADATIAACPLLVGTTDSDGVLVTGSVLWFCYSDYMLLVKVNCQLGTLL